MQVLGDIQLDFYLHQLIYIIPNSRTKRKKSFIISIKYRYIRKSELVDGSERFRCDRYMSPCHAAIKVRGDEIIEDVEKPHTCGKMSGTRATTIKVSAVYLQVQRKIDMNRYILLQNHNHQICLLTYFRFKKRVYFLSFFKFNCA